MLNKTKSSNNFIESAGLLLVCMLLVNAGNYGINLILARWLGPEIYAEVSVIAGIVLAFSFIAVCFQIAASRYVTTTADEKEKLRGIKIAVFLKKRSVQTGVIATVFLLLVVGPIANYLKFNSILPLVFLFIGLPLYFLMNTNRGILAGRNNIIELASTYLSEMLVRLGFTLALLLFSKLTNSGIETEAVALGFLVSFIVSWAYSQTDLEISEQVEKFTLPVSVKLFIGFTALYEFSQIVINNSDLILVKHYFDNYEAGQYGAIALMGRVVFFASWSVVTLLIPRIAEARDNPKLQSKLLFQALTLVLSIGLMVSGLCYYFPDIIIGIVFGDDYLSGSSLLWKYALATSLFAAANVFVYFHLSLGNYVPVITSVLFGCIQLGSIIMWHGSLQQVIHLQVICMSFLLISILFIHHFNLKTNEDNQSSIGVSLSSGKRYA